MNNIPELEEQIKSVNLNLKGQVKGHNLTTKSTIERVRLEQLHKVSSEHSGHFCVKIT